MCRTIMASFMKARFMIAFHFLFVVPACTVGGGRLEATRRSVTGSWTSETCALQPTALVLTGCWYRWCQSVSCIQSWWRWRCCMEGWICLQSDNLSNITSANKTWKRFYSGAICAPFGCLETVRGFVL